MSCAQTKVKPNELSDHFQLLFIFISLPSTLYGVIITYRRQLCWKFSPVSYASAKENGVLRSNRLVLEFLDLLSSRHQWFDIVAIDCALRSVLRCLFSFVRLKKTSNMGLDGLPKNTTMPVRQR